VPGDLNMEFNLTNKENEKRKRVVLERLLQEYFEFSKPILSSHFMMRWRQRFNTKSAEEIFNIMQRSVAVIKDDKFELYDSNSHIRMSYEFHEDSVVFCTIFELKLKYRNNWISRLETHLE